MTPAARPSLVALALVALGLVGWWLWTAAHEDHDVVAVAEDGMARRSASGSGSGRSPTMPSRSAAERAMRTGEPGEPGPGEAPAPATPAEPSDLRAGPPSDLGVPAGPARLLVPPEPGEPPPPRGSLGAEQVRTVIREALPELRFCFEWQLSRHPELAGRLTMDFTIADDGTVIEAHVAEDLLADDTVSRCFTHVMGTLHFPAPDPPGEVNVRYPFVLSGSPPARAPEGI